MSKTLPRVVIDLNSTDEDGETIVLLSDVTSGVLERGRMVTAYEPEDGVAAPAMVSSVHPEQGVAFLLVNWRAIRRDQKGSRPFPLERRAWEVNLAGVNHQRQVKRTLGSSRSIALKQTTSA